MIYNVCIQIIKWIPLNLHLLRCFLLSEFVTLTLLPFKCQYVTQIHVRKLIVACITGYDLLSLTVDLK